MRVHAPELAEAEAAVVVSRYPPHPRYPSAATRVPAAGVLPTETVNRFNQDAPGTQSPAASRTGMRWPRDGGKTGHCRDSGERRERSAPGKASTSRVCLGRVVHFAKALLITHQAHPSYGHETQSTSMARRRPQIGVRAPGNVVAWRPEPRYRAPSRRKMSLVGSQEGISAVSLNETGLANGPSTQMHKVCISRRSPHPTQSGSRRPSMSSYIHEEELAGVTQSFAPKDATRVTPELKQTAQGKRMPREDKPLLRSETIAGAPLATKSNILTIRLSAQPFYPLLRRNNCPIHSSVNMAEKVIIPDGQSREPDLWYTIDGTFPVCIAAWKLCSCESIYILYGTAPIVRARGTSLTNWRRTTNVSNLCARLGYSLWPGARRERVHPQRR